MPRFTHSNLEQPFLFFSPEQSLRELGLPTDSFSSGEYRGHDKP